MPVLRENPSGFVTAIGRDPCMSGIVLEAGFTMQTTKGKRPLEIHRRFLSGHRGERAGGPAFIHGSHVGSRPHVGTHRGLLSPRLCSA